MKDTTNTKSVSFFNLVTGKNIRMKDQFVRMWTIPVVVMFINPLCN